ncbi:hypothetical protein CDIK_2668 [Cucumispora dikerogammari]|nr:hypothetical protein CDIK_2668 [Cucumispora dikerogammari]
MTKQHFYSDVLELLLSRSSLHLIRFLQDKQVLKATSFCDLCVLELRFVKYKRHTGGYANRWMNKNCAYYKKCFSIRKNSFFSKFSLFLQKIICIIFKWGGSSNQKEILREVNVNRNKVRKGIFELRDLCFKHNETFPIRLGGPRVICQIDESLFRHKPKNHRNRATNNEIWMFGIADTSFTPEKIYLKSVENRSAAILLLHISLVCRPSTIIHSDR